MQEFGADKIKIVDLLTKKDIQYKIPLNQREYSWGKDYIENFWDYLIDEEDNYFLGTIVLNKEFQDKGYKEIVDGQQRLLTITIFLSILRNIFYDLKEVEKSNKIQGSYIADLDDDGEAEGYKITPGLSLRDFFEKYIQDKKGNIYESIPETKEEERVFDNYKLLESKINNYIGEEKDKKIKKLKILRERIKKLELVYIEVSSGEDAFTFFETINATGMKLSTADVLKNLLFKNTTKSIEKINFIWENKIVSNLSYGDKDFDITKFIRHFWLSKHRKITDKKLYKELKNCINNELYKDYDSLILDLVKHSKLYGIILYPNVIDFPGLKMPFYHFLKSIDNLNVIQVNPLILSLLKIIQLDKFNEINTLKIKKFIEKIENFIFIYKVTGKSPSPLEGLFSGLAIDFYEINNKDISRKNLENLIDKSIGKIDKLFPTEEEYKVNLISRLTYSRKNENIIKYFFDKIYNFSEEQNNNNVTIEHIYPRNPKTLKIDNEIVNSIGNLTVLGPIYNKTASNNFPINKIEYYKKSTISNNKELAEYIEKKGDFLEEDIIKRGEKLLNDSWNIFN